MKIKILIPIYNDWQSVYMLLSKIDAEVEGLNDEISVIIVNDSSTEVKNKFELSLKNLKSVNIINMKVVIELIIKDIDIKRLPRRLK